MQSLVGCVRVVKETLFSWLPWLGKGVVNRMETSYPTKIITLWGVFLLGTLFHTQLGLMPLFHGIDIAHTEGDATTEIGWILWLMLAFFALPLLLMVATLFTHSRQFRGFHFVVTALYSVLNFLHIVMDLGVQPIVWSQITLMVILFLVGLLLNIVSYRWMRHWRVSDRLQQPISL